MHALKLEELCPEETYTARRNTGINRLFVSGRKNCIVRVQELFDFG
jgi:hypothetical protein